MKRAVWTLITLVMVFSMIALTGCNNPTPKPTEQTTEQAPAATEETQAPTEEATQAASGNGPVKITIFVGFGTGTDPAQIEAALAAGIGKARLVLARLLAG